MLTSNVPFNFAVSLISLQVLWWRVAKFIRIVDSIRIDVSFRPHELKKFISVSKMNN